MISRKMLRKIFMVAVVLVLILLIIVTPNLMGREQDISSIPQLLIDRRGGNETFIDVHSAFSHYMYSSITVHVQGTDNISFERIMFENNTYDLHFSISDSFSKSFILNVTLEDKKNRPFDYNATVMVKEDEKGLFLSIHQEDSSVPKIVREENLPFKDTIPMREGA